MTNEQMFFGILGVIIALHGTTIGVSVFLWNRVDRKIEVLSQKIDILFEKFTALDKRVAIT